MFDWEDLRHFAALAQEGSLSAAARALQVDHATVARRIVSLEKALQVKLVDRRPKSYALTPEGERIATLATQMQEPAFAIDRSARSTRPAVAGIVTISAPPALSSTRIAPRLTNLKKEYPGIHIRLLGEKRSASLSRSEADIAVRLSRPTEGRLVARRIGTMTFGFYASAEYVSKHTETNFEFIAYDEAMDKLPQQQWLKRFAGTRPVVLRASELEAQVAAASAGLGVAILPNFIAEGNGRLSRIDVPTAPMKRDIWLVAHRDVRRSALARAVMQFLIECFASAKV